MANMFGANYEKHPMVSPIWDRLEGMEEKLTRLDMAVSTILKHLGLSLSDSSSLDATSETTTPSEPESCPTTQTSDEPYIYKPLDAEKAEIRLLALNNTESDSDTVSGEIVHFDLDHSKQAIGSKRYNALSYHWGEPKMDHRIIVNGHAFWVTKNLESALRQMRQNGDKQNGSSGSKVIASTARSLWWIDQICINQADIEERSSQVSLMRRIYKNALSVQVWLGDGMEGSALAMDVIGRIGRPPRRGPGEKEVEYPAFSEEDVKSHWSAMRLLLTQPYWERSWIRQEITLGSRATVSWGKSSVGFDAVAQAVMAIEYADSLGHTVPGTQAEEEDPHRQGSGDGPDIKRPFYHHAQSIRNLRKQSHGGVSYLPMPELLLHARDCSATDLKDKLFSMIGLADPEIYRLQADYRLSLPEVLRSAACRILPLTHGLRLLGACQNAERRHGLPSWVPNLLDEWKYRPFQPDDSKHVYGIAESNVDFEDDTLLVKGYLVDSISTVCEATVPSGNVSTEQIDAVYASWQKYAEDALEAGQIDEMISMNKLKVKKDMFWLDFLSTHRMASAFMRYSADDGSLLPEHDSSLKLEYMGLNLKLAESYLLPASWETRLHPLRRIRASLKKYGPGRQLGLCAGKRTLVLLPGDARPGDQVAVLRGGTFAYVLRKALPKKAEPREAGSEEEYVLVGEAFLPDTAMAMAATSKAPKVMDALRIV